MPLAPSHCAFVMYTVISAQQRFVAPPPQDLPSGCALLFAYGSAAPAASRWTRVQAEPYTPSYARALRGRRLSRVFKIGSHLLNETRPLVYVDSKRAIKNAQAMQHVFERMRECGASFFSFLHPQRAHALLDEIKAIRRYRRSENYETLAEQEKWIQNNAALATSDLRRRTVVNDGSLLFRLPGDASRRFEVEWQRVYDAGSDRDQPAFAIAYHALFGERDPRTCGNAVWLVEYGGNRDLRYGHTSFVRG